MSIFHFTRTCAERISAPLSNGVALAALASSSMGAGTKTAHFDSGLESFVRGTTSTIVTHESGPNGFMRLSRSDNGGIADIGLVTASNGSFLGDYVSDLAYRIGFSIDPGSVPTGPVWIRLRSGVDQNGWYYDLGTIEPGVETWTQRSVSFDPRWDDATAIENGWRKDGPSVDSFIATLSHVDLFEIRILNQATPVGIDDVWIETWYVADACRADINGDGVVNFEDLGRLLENWESGVHPNRGGDVNGDGFVDMLDLESVLEFWGEVCGL